jgi:hypothetical protein
VFLTLEILVRAEAEQAAALGGRQVGLNDALASGNGHRRTDAT